MGFPSSFRSHFCDLFDGLMFFAHHYSTESCLSASGNHFFERHRSPNQEKYKANILQDWRGRTYKSKMAEIILVTCTEDIDTMQAPLLRAQYFKWMTIHFLTAQNFPEWPTTKAMKGRTFTAFDLYFKKLLGHACFLLSKKLDSKVLMKMQKKSSMRQFASTN